MLLLALVHAMALTWPPESGGQSVVSAHARVQGPRSEGPDPGGVLVDPDDHGFDDELNPSKGSGGILAPSVTEDPLCANGVIGFSGTEDIGFSGQVCCAFSCGHCGATTSEGVDCSSLPGGSPLCCPSEFVNAECKRTEQTACVVPKSSHGKMPLELVMSAMTANERIDFVRNSTIGALRRGSESEKLARAGFREG